MPAMRNRLPRTALREPVSLADLAASAGPGAIPPGPDIGPSLEELAARAAEDAKPPECPLCEGAGALGPHDPACPRARSR
jgi:hypothetical protein